MGGGGGCIHGYKGIGKNITNDVETSGVSVGFIFLVCVFMGCKGIGKQITNDGETSGVSVGFIIIIIDYLWHPIL